MVDQAIAENGDEDPTSKIESTSAIPEESTKTDLELLEEEENENDNDNENENDKNKPFEIPEDEEDRLQENRRQLNQNRDVDKLINESSETMQAEFLRGAIPKVVFKHALKGTWSGDDNE